LSKFFSPFIKFTIALPILLTLFLIIITDKKSITQTVIIPKGSSCREIASILKDEGVIKSKLSFLILAKIYRATSKLKAGEYEFDSKMGTVKILKKLKEGKTVIHAVVIPEGWTLKDIANLLEKKQLADKYKFLDLCYDQSFIKNILPTKPPNLEGYLFPDTYFLYRGMNEEEIISLMVNRFNDIIKKETKIDDEILHRTIILASIIEKEARIKEEFPIISAVFHNRLKKNMSLESCVTVLYALGEKKPHLSIEDTKVSSSYNTYINPGLPPGPICNPGILAIKSVLNPADVDYLYFVSKGDGSHIFSKTNSSHISYKNALAGRDVNKREKER